MRQRITAERARELFRYSADDGNLYRRTSRGGMAAGMLAGTRARNGYINVIADRKSYLAHRLVWLIVTGDWPQHEIDHIDGDKANNRWSNLRDVTRRVNHENRRRARAGSTTGLLGARLRKRRGTFFAEIKVDGRAFYLGQFSTAEEAHAAYMQAKKRFHEVFT